MGPLKDKARETKCILAVLKFLDTKPTYSAAAPSRYGAGPTNDLRMMRGSCAKRFRVRSPT